MSDVVNSLFTLLFFGAAVVILVRLFRGNDNWIEMPEHIFWEFVAGHAPAEVLVVLKGVILKRSCYVYAHNGLIFYCWSRPADIPMGVSVTMTFELQAS